MNKLALVHIDDANHSTVRCCNKKYAIVASKADRLVILLITTHIKRGISNFTLVGNEAKMSKAFLFDIGDNY